MKQAVIPIVAAVVWGLCFFALPAQTKYGGGTGEPNDPYLIYTAEQMNAIGADSNDWDKSFKLMADIDLGGYTGEEFNIIGYWVGWCSPDNRPFTGVFDGNNHIISNFTYTSAGSNFIGLFSFVNDPNAVIKDLGLIEPNVDAGAGSYVGSLVGMVVGGTITNCYVESGRVFGRRYVGGLVGWNYEGTIINCYSKGHVSGDYFVGGLVGQDGQCSPLECFGGTISNCYSKGSIEGLSNVGGLVGDNRGTITNCYSTCSITGERLVGGLVGESSGTITDCHSTGTVSGGDDIGGLVGYKIYGTITDCYQTGGVSGDENVGGLVGMNNRGTITNCYSTGSVKGTTNAGGLVGLNYEGTFTASFWDIETSGQSTSAGGTGLPTAEMQMQVTFTDAGWDFNTPVWTIDEGVDYPRLWCELVPVLHAEPEVTLGTSNTISWESVVGAIEYYAECTEDVNFTSIVYNSGWITETSYEFTGLQSGQRYWYSVKARNAAGVETNRSNVESSLQCTLADAVDIELAPESLKNENLKDALLNKINVVLEMIDEGLYENALNKLENDILQKMNGCGERGEPDKNDWIITCEEQNQVSPLVMETIAYVKGLAGK